MNTGEGQRVSRRFALALALTALILVVEAVGGWWANSLALLSDAGHVVTDAFALALGWFAARQAMRPATAQKTWGYHRAGIIAAFTNALTLLGITLFIIIEAIGRLRHPAAVQPPIMVAAALVGIGVNLAIARFLPVAHVHHPGEAAHDHEHEDLNTRAVVLHVLGDVGASVGVIIGAILILLTHAPIIDTLISCVIALVIAVGAVRIGRDALNLLLEGVPKGVATEQIRHDLRGIRGVYDVHDLHVWGITDTRRALTCHAVIDDMPINASAPLLNQINHLLQDRYGIAHTTVQFERRQRDAAPPCACSADCDCSPAASQAARTV